MDQDLNRGVQSDDPQVDLTNCDREPIHVLGRVQSFGALLSVSPDWVVNHVSTNVHRFLGVEAEELVGEPLANILLPSALHDIRSALQVIATDDAIERLFGIELRADLPLFDVAIHLSGRSVVLELEPHATEGKNEFLSYVRPMIDRIGKASSVAELCDGAARQLRALTKFDRVMVYQFMDDDSGTVVSEALAPGMEPFKGLRYPASDIPKQARALYLRSTIRIISDAADEGHPIIPSVSPEGEPLDLSLSTTRAVSPIHLEYLRNMGVAASMSISIIRRGKLWGLFACHNNTPRSLSYDIRSAAELFGQLFSFLLDQKISDEEREEATRGRILHDQLMAQIAENTSVLENFSTITKAIKPIIPFDGAVGWIDGKFVSEGQTPTREEFAGLVRFLNTTATSRIYAKRNLAEVYPAADDFVSRAAGLLVLPVSRSPRDYLVLFRKEIAQSVVWAGNPDKPVELGPNGIRLTPRKSFEAWKQIVRNECAPWTQGEIVAAEGLRMTLLEVVLRITDASNKERVKSQERQELLIAELNHRVRNILNLIRSVISQSSTQAQTVGDFTKVIGGRIHALARAHDQITRENWAPASVRELLETELEAYLGSKSHRVFVKGPNPLLDPTAFSTLSLVVHELVTNAAKYGALSDSSGSVEVQLSIANDEALEISWAETGGPPIQAQPSRRGFGTTIIERSIPYDLKGEAETFFDVTGLRARFVIPPSFVSGVEEDVPKKAAKEEQDVVQSRPLSGDVLLVEDNIIIALDAESFLRELGAAEVHLANSVEDAFAVIKNLDISFALLDVNLGSETSEPLAVELADQSIPFVFATGYGDMTKLADRFSEIRVVQKPYDKATLQAAITL